MTIEVMWYWEGRMSISLEQLSSIRKDIEIRQALEEQIHRDEIEHIFRISELLKELE